MSANSTIDPPEPARGVRPFTVQWQEDVALFRFGDEPLFFATDLDVRDQLLRELDQCSKSEAIKVVVIVGFPKKAGSQEYEAFYRQTSEAHQRVRIERMLNVFNQFSLAIVNLNKFVIFVDSGRVIWQFLNVGLACDYRIIGDDTVIEKAYLKRGMVPTGGGALLLSRLLGRSRAYELLLSEQNITATGALRLGLVNEVVPVADLDGAALRAARRFAGLPPATVLGVKRLLNYDLRDLSDYLVFENQQLLQARRKADF